MAGNIVDDEMMPPVHPGEILLHEFLLPKGMTAHRLALCIGVDPRRIHDIVQGKRSITADTALRLGRFFRVSPEIWMDLQTKYDLEVASLALKDRLEVEVRPCAELQEA
jgi:addiction module HigA family antidote